MTKSALVAVVVALLLGGTSLATAKTRSAAGAHRHPSHAVINETTSRTTAPNPYYRLSDQYYDYSDTAPNPYYRLSDQFYDYSDPYRGLYDFFAVPPHIPGYNYGHVRMPGR